MQHVFRAAWALIALSGLWSVLPAASQEASRAYVVTYVEVAPEAKQQALDLLRQAAAAARKQDGNVGYELLQRIERPHHFAILETWRDRKAQEAHAAAATTKEWRDKLRQLQSAPYDERPHGVIAPASGKESHPAGAVHVVTHVDFIPPKKDEGILAIKELVEQSRKESGNLRFDALQQESRPNHLTLVEEWADQQAVERHATAAHTRQFRDKLLPMSGSLFDERFYRVVSD